MASEGKRASGLRPAHKGYIYQDLLTAYALARAVVDRPDCVIVDVKKSDPDVFDDLEVVSGGIRIRRQIKWSQDANRRLSASKFTYADSDLRFDLLVKTDLASGTPVAEYRLCATWGVPAPDDQLSALLVPVADVGATVASTASLTFRLDAEAIWPDSGEPLWSCLNGITRAQFMSFCSRFILELALPAFSASLLDMQPIERALIDILNQEIGIGRYPNQNRSPIDVAALLIGLATRARSGQELLTPSDIERELGIRTDFGRISQAYPIDETVYYDRKVFRQSLFEGVSVGSHQLVCGPPGAGKSWELTRLAEDLRASGFIVARHYCFLEPSDELVEKRVTSDALFGNLRAEILDAAPQLVNESIARYAAGPQELEATLAATDRGGKRVALLIDGLDHIGRVKASSRHLSEAETDIIARLAMLALPASTVLVIGSQPGPHLTPLRERLGIRLAERNVPLWAHDDMIALAERHGVQAALDEAGMENGPALDALADRAEGSPLYLHYLAKGLMAALTAATIASVPDWVRSFPSAAGDIGRYYEHLYRTASKEGQAVADLLAFLDFSVSKEELGELGGHILRGWIEPALKHLAPILTSATGQGGVRIFHESFRRFMAEEMARQGRSANDILQPVIGWLEQIGFFESAKAYRFLLPALRRAGRDEEVLARVDMDFVSRSIEHGHPSKAIVRNLLLAADVATHVRNWPVVARVSELQRAADSAFDQGLPSSYWPTYLAIFGPEALSARLMFDGRPTLHAAEGLKCCSLIDDAGGIAPWAEYLALDDDGNDEQSMGGLSGDDPSAAWPVGSQIELAILHGQLRLGSLPAVWRNLARSLDAQQADISVSFIRGIAQRVARSGAVTAVKRLASLVHKKKTRLPVIHSRAGAALWLGIADELKRLGDTVGAKEAAVEAMSLADLAWVACECIPFGVTPEAARHLALTPEAMVTATRLGSHHFSGDSGVRQWVSTVRILAHDAASCDVLEHEKARLDGPGWYRCWLRFVIGLAKSEAAAANGRIADWAGPFRELVGDTKPFVGTPRGCDLYPIERLIDQSISWGLSHLKSASEWQIALDCIVQAQGETATTLFREEGGPILISSLLEALLRHASDPVAGRAVLTAVDRLFGSSHVGTYYQTHAEHDFIGAQINTALGDRETALGLWAKGAVYASAYGWHKDITLFDLIESAGSLSPRNRDGALKALADCYPLIGPVLRHTDHKETKHAPGTWRQVLAGVNVCLALDVIARSEMERWGGAWYDDVAIERIGEVALEAGADPALLDACLATVPLDNDRAEVTVERRLPPIAEMLKSDHGLALQSLRRLQAETANATGMKATAAIKLVETFIERHGLRLPFVPGQAAAADEGWVWTQEKEKGDPWYFRQPPFPTNATVLELMAGLRKAEESRGWKGPETWDDVVLALGYHIPALVEAGEEDAAVRIVRFFARDICIFDSDALHLVELAESLMCAGCMQVSAVTYVLAFAATKGNAGWRPMGDMSHQHLLATAFGIDADTAMTALADEIADGIRAGRFGLSRRIVETLATHGDPLAAEEAWRQSYRVIAHRLPSLAAQLETWGPPLCRHDCEGWSVDECLVAVLLARLARPSIRVKIAALKGVSLAVQRKSEVVVIPLRRWLSRDAHASSIALVLQMLCYFEPHDFSISRAIPDILEGYAQGGHWGISRLAGVLLARIDKARPVNRTTITLPEAGSEHTTGLAFKAGGEALERLGAIWPSLAKVTEHVVLASIWGVESHEVHCCETWKLMFGRDGKAWPPTTVLQWEVELFQSKLNEYLFGLRKELCARGKWSPGAEDKIAFDLMPTIKGHLGCYSSRCLRPPIAKPSEMVEGALKPQELGNEEGDYKGWFRLAHIEEEYLRESEYSAANSKVTSFSAVAALRFGETLPNGVSPFMPQQVEDFFAPEWDGTAGGALVARVKCEDWLCESPLMGPAAWIVTGLRLEPPQIGMPLVWNDGTGQPAAVLRYWRVRSEGTYEGDAADLTGADLLLRGDLYRSVATGLPLKLEYITRINNVAHNGLDM
tara:strand:+ start:2986 stop:9072 length:6087 start_codon:yes stop_codon:yes gene_type:complete